MSIELLIAVEENVSIVPVVTVPVLVIVNVGFAIHVRQKFLYMSNNVDTIRSPGIPSSQPEMNWLATASTSEGENARSNAWGMAVPSLRMLSTV